MNVAHYPPGFEDGTRPHFLRLRGTWVCMWPAYPSASVDLSVFVAHLNTLNNVRLPGPDAFYVRTHEWRVQ